MNSCSSLRPGLGELEIKTFDIATQALAVCVKWSSYLDSAGVAAVSKDFAITPISRLKDNPAPLARWKDGKLGEGSQGAALV